MSDMIVAICAIAKLENEYIYEWAKYHLHLGFEHIYIYDNNDIDGERITDVFVNTDIEKSVTIFDIRGQKCMQLAVYNDCYQNCDFDWCAFIDIDEFITINPVSGFDDINSFLGKREAFEAVHLNWLCYGDNSILLYDEKPVLSRFTKPISPYNFVASLIQGTPENYHIKSIIRKGLSIDWEKEHDPFPNPHTPAGLNKICNASGDAVNNSPWIPIDYNVIYIRHYITMSIEEYSRKIVRQAADSNSKNRYTISRFFRYNSFSLSKILYTRKHFGIRAIPRAIIERIKWKSITNHSIISYLYGSYRRNKKSS